MKSRSYPVCVSVVDQRLEIENGAVGVGILKQYAGNVAIGEIHVTKVRDDHLDAHGIRPRDHDGNVLRVAAMVDVELTALVMSEALETNMISVKLRHNALQWIIEKNVRGNRMYVVSISGTS